MNNEKLITDDMTPGAGDGEIVKPEDNLPSSGDGESTVSNITD